MERSTPPGRPDVAAATTDLLRRRDRLVSEAQALIDRGELTEAQEVLRQLAGATIDGTTLARTDPFLAAIAGERHLVATCDPRRTPHADEVVIVYGNYPHQFNNVVVNNPIRRHVADFWTFQHARVEYDSRWDGIDRIFIINVDERIDRYDAVLRELAAARAPLHRITRVPACRVDAALGRAVGGSLACLHSHSETLRMGIAGGYRHTLILEDDFCFTSDLDDHLNDLQTFLERDYDYWICLIATSKYGLVVPTDDLVATSHQPCTNTGGYLVSRAGLRRLLPVFEKAAVRLRASGDADTWAADRCWAVLQASGKFLVFRRKFGFQVASYSDIEGSISRYLD